ncbi:MAG: cache domain-containing protein [Proteobacteria bacterium]|nr:cache domain-containing protein [Pseudomonadota bacterium]
MKLSRVFRRRLFFGALVLVLAALILFSTDEPSANVKLETFERLNSIRSEKKSEVFEYFSEVRRSASSIAEDSFMLRAFETIGQPGSAAVRDLEFKIDERYVTKFGKFYDILFVDPSGYVFHSIKKESDYRTNLIDAGDLTKSISRPLLDPDIGEKFVGFDYYAPSDEPAAFFYIPVYKGEEHRGWFILQFALNRIKSILADREELGRTGEVYLVNAQKLMLTDSRFMSDSTALQLVVDTVAVSEALKEGEGNRIIEDYRNVKVFSSYEKFNLFGVDWLLIAEIDEREVITEYFKKNKSFFQRRLANYSANMKREKHIRSARASKLRRVDVDEFAKTIEGAELVTYGVATCTAVAVVVPDGPAYLIHISPTDEIYMTNSLTKFILGGDEYHNLLGAMVERVKRYDVYPSELNGVQFVVIAPHASSINKVVDTIVEAGIELANIKFLYNPKALNANVFLAHHGSGLDVEWVGDGGSYIERAEEAIDLGSVVRAISGYDATSVN